MQFNPAAMQQNITSAKNGRFLERLMRDDFPGRSDAGPYFRAAASVCRTEGLQV